MTIASGPNPLPVKRWRYDTRAAHRLSHNSGDVSLFCQYVLHIIGACEITLLAATKGAPYGIGRRDMLRAREQRANPAAEETFTADRYRIERGSVKGVPK